MLNTLKESKFGYPLYFAKRLLTAAKLSLQYTGQAFKGGLISNEVSNFTYPLTSQNEYYLSLLVSAVTGKDEVTISNYFNELKNNAELNEYVINTIAKSPYRNKRDLRCDFGSRLAWYAIVRANKSKVVIENGIEIGLNAMALCSAIAKNREEGFEGNYYGFDINPNAGHLLVNSAFTAFGKLLINDGIDSLLKFGDLTVDFYFSDGLRTYEYEKKEFDVLIKKLSPKGVVVTNKANFSPALAELASMNKKQFTYFQEQPKNHWYQGSGLGILT